MLEAEDALAGVQKPGPFGRPGAAGVRLSISEPPCTAIMARAVPGLPAAPGAVFDGAATIVWTAPGQWLCFGPLPVLVDATLTDLSGARVVFSVAGPAARDALATLLPIDLHPRAFGPGAAAATIAAHIGVLVWLAPDGSFRLACTRSFSVALWQALLHAAEAFGGEVAAG